MIKNFIIKAISIPVGYTLSLIAVLLPLELRNKYSDLLGFLIGVALQSKMVVDFFMTIGFKGSETDSE